MTHAGSSAKIVKRIESVIAEVDFISTEEKRYIMKKHMMTGVLLLMLLLCSACGSKNLQADSVEENTLLIKQDGSVQAAILEEFDREYYDIDEARVFIEDAVAEYNEAEGKDSVIFNDLKISPFDDDKVCLILTYKDMDTYDDVTGAKIRHLTIDEAVQEELIPKELTSLREGSIADGKAVAGENTQYKVIVLSSKLHIMVEGKIKYYTNAAVLNNAAVQTAGKRKKAVIIYK